MNFGEALEDLKDGHYVTRDSWDCDILWIHLKKPDRKSRMSEPYIYMKTMDKKIAPWNARYCDLLANDWDLIVVAEEKK